MRKKDAEGTDLVEEEEECIVSVSRNTKGVTVYGSRLLLSAIKSLFRKDSEQDAKQGSRDEGDLGDASEPRSYKC